MPTWSGLWNGFYNIPYAPLGNNGNTKDYNKTEWNQFARALKGPGGRRMGAIIRALTGSAVGTQTALSTIRQVPARPDPTAAYTGGGYVPAVVKDDINRLTTAADETYIDAATTLKRGPTTYPVDKGAGGPKTPGIF